MVKEKTVSLRTAAVVTGLSLLLMTGAALFSGYVIDLLNLRDTGTFSVENLTASDGLFRAGIMGWILIVITDVAAAWGLYVFFAPVNRQLFLAAAWFRLIYAGILGVAVSCLLAVLVLASDSINLEVLKTFSPEVILFCVHLFNEIWNAGLILFGLHLLILGGCCFIADYVPSLFGGILMAAGVGYLLVHPGFLLFPQYRRIIKIVEIIFMLPAMGEVVFGIWLLLRGGKNQGSRI